MAGALYARGSASGKRVQCQGGAKNHVVVLPDADQETTTKIIADSAFGLASNSHGPVAAGIDAHITFQAAVAAGDTLVARAVEVQRSRRIGVYRIDVVRAEADGSETPVSSFTGTVYIKG